MKPSDLIQGKDYHLAVIDQPPKVVNYRHETLNYWMFDDNSTGKMILLHKQQVIANITELQ